MGAKSRFRCGVCQVVSVCLASAFLAAAAAFLLLVNSSVLSIHSCHIYVPHKLAAAQAVWESLLAYVNRRGLGALGEEVAALVREDVLDVAPFPQLRGEVEGKHLLMVGGAKTPVAFKRARQLGVKLTLVDDASMAGYAKGMKVDRFVGIEGFGHVSVRSQGDVYAAVAEATTRCGAHEAEGCHLGGYDGVFTLVEDHGPLVSFIAERMQLVGSPFEASKAARSKYAVRQAMRRAGMNVPRFAMIESAGGLRAAAEAVRFPAFIKPVFGVQATFAAKVKDMDELEATYARFQEQIDVLHHPIYHHGKEMILEQLLSGPEIQLEMMVSGGKVVYHCFSSQYSPSRDSLMFPTVLSPSDKEGLLDVSTRMLEAVGLTHGVVHLELFLDPVLGPQVIEVNNRLSRGFLPQRFLHQAIFGEQHADYYGSVFALALGKEPAFVQRSGPPLHMALYLDKPSTEWWRTDPKDAPNRGWEAEGPCGVFFGASPQHAVARGQAFQRESIQHYKRSLVDQQDAVLLLGVLGLAVLSMRLFFVGIW